MKRTIIIDALKRTDFGEKICVKGWVRSRRGNKNVSFIALNDGSTIKNIQIVVDLEKFSEEQLKPITTGSCICCEGTLVESMGKGQTSEIQADSIEVYGTADPEQYPLQKKGLSMEYLRTIAHLRPRTYVFPRAWLFLFPHAAHHGFRLRGRRTDVSSDDQEPLQPQERRRGQD